jgi:hypothetical protein
MPFVLPLVRYDVEFIASAVLQHQVLPEVVVC